jgi:hypothetical protein
MRASSKWAAVLVVVATAVATAASAQSAADGRARSFARALADAMARRDKAAVAAMMRFPVVALAGGFPIPISDRATLFQVYDVVFTPELRCVVEASAGSKSLAVDADGVTLGDSRVRADNVNGALKITRINVPPASGNAPPPPSKPQRAGIRWGKGEAQFAGRLYGDGVDSYIVSAQRGDVLEARIERFPGRGASLRVVDLKSGRPLEQPGGAAPRLWTDTIQQAGEYRVDVVRHAPYCQPPFTYLLTITLR